MKDLLALLAATVILGFPSAYAQTASSTTIETQTTSEPVEKDVKVERETEVIPVPVETPAPVEHTSSSSSSNSYESSSVKKVAPATATTTTTKKRQIASRPKRSCAKTIKTTCRKPAAEQVIEKKESYSSHSENTRTTTSR